MQFTYYFCFLVLFAPGRAYHAIEQFGAWQGLPCNKSECLYSSELISNLAPGKAYHAFCILFEFSFSIKMQVVYHFDLILFSLLVPGRAYHAINLNDCTLHG